ncbi:efflux RND transporter periplasmic adaptor subunit [Altererythrobacter xixiisoli]|uniref:Efflux RND transporter periplasmic adaptor subunit n=1 Tax=Croceibacterium xixiisoli TaxID=1476466 RepID=A0A6I4TZN9_9SPHN|nr:efflux RND transporter periplasmic adaptor subunit [Croceibacterium xixiisoli]MXP00109.1 efflux RND transporter periplasmic adaptor subunit [Croceibacterium xixiisoli]
MRWTHAVVIGALALAGCSGQAEPPAPPPLEVETIVIASRPIPNIIELPGRVEPERSAEVRARVTGIVQRQLYVDGSDVRAGQPLFEIDPSELRASYAQTKASLDRARATAANAAAVVTRYRPLVDENAISKQEYDAAVAASREAAASVAEIEAQLRSASLQLGYTTVRAPLTGRAGRAQVTEGAFVNQAEATLMARIDQVSPIYVTFAQSANEFLNIRRGISDGTLDVPANSRIDVHLVFADGSEYPITGTIDFLDRVVDTETGTLQLRARFANPEGMLLPGEFVRVRVEAGQLQNGIVVPQSAVTVGEKTGTVFVVDGTGKVAVRNVELGALANENWIIKSGLTPGDVVIVNNLMKVRPGMQVKTTRAQPAAAASRAPARANPAASPAASPSAAANGAR